MRTPTTVILSLAVAAAAVLASPSASADSSASGSGPAGSLSPDSAVDGTDVSSHRHNVAPVSDWIQARSAGTDFAYVKATEGTDYVNPNWLGDINLARLAGIRGGNYHLSLIHI